MVAEAKIMYEAILFPGFTCCDSWPEFFCTWIVLDAGTPLKPEHEDQTQELRTHIKALQDGTANVRTLQKLILLCNANPAIPADGLLSPTGALPSSPLPARGPLGMLQGDIWQGGRMFDALIKPLMQFIHNIKVPFFFCKTPFIRYWPWWYLLGRRAYWIWSLCNMGDGRESDLISWWGWGVFFVVSCALC
jgi:hypothetical protein